MPKIKIMIFCQALWIDNECYIWKIQVIFTLGIIKTKILALSFSSGEFIFLEEKSLKTFPFIQSQHFMLKAVQQAEPEECKHHVEPGVQHPQGMEN